MQMSKIVEIDGIFIGAVVKLAEAEGWRFVAADHRADAANGCIAPTLHGAQQLAKRAFFSARPVHASAPHAINQPDAPRAGLCAWPPGVAAAA